MTVPATKPCPHCDEPWGGHDPWCRTNDAPRWADLTEEQREVLRGQVRRTVERQREHGDTS